MTKDKIILNSFVSTLYLPKSNHANPFYIFFLQYLNCIQIYSHNWPAMQSYECYGSFDRSFSETKLPNMSRRNSEIFSELWRMPDRGRMESSEPLLLRAWRTRWSSDCIAMECGSVTVSRPSEEYFEVISDTDRFGVDFRFDLKNFITWWSARLWNNIVRCYNVNCHTGKIKMETGSTINTMDDWGTEAWYNLCKKNFAISILTRLNLG